LWFWADWRKTLGFWRESDSTPTFGDWRVIYVASRVKHAAMWRILREKYAIISTWIDEAGEGETDDLSELWGRITAEVANCDALVLHVAPGDCPLKGALVEVGMAIALGKPVFVSAFGVELEERSLRPIGSWLHHKSVVLDAGQWSLDRCLQQASEVTVKS